MAHIPGKFVGHGVLWLLATTLVTLLSAARCSEDGAPT